jgi:branched-chain amino acid transport system permease protein
VIRPVVGGAGSLWGPILGSFILSPLAEVSRIYFTSGSWSGLHLVVYGLLLIGVVLFLPQGAYPHLAQALRRKTARG